MTATETATILTLIALFGGIIGGFLAYRTGLSKAKDAIASQLIEFLKTENEAMQRKIDRLQGQFDTQVSENKLLKQQFAFVIDVMNKTYGLTIAFVDDTLHIQDKHGASTFTKAHE